MQKEKFAILALGVFCLSIAITGFYITGSPNSQKLIRYDEKRLSDLSEIRYAIERYATNHQKLPESLKVLDFTDEKLDPETNTSYEYVIADNRNYKLCANFSNDYKEYRAQGGGVYYFDSSIKLDFTKGKSCISFFLPPALLEKPATQTNTDAITVPQTYQPDLSPGAISP